MHWILVATAVALLGAPAGASNCGTRKLATVKAAARAALSCHAQAASRGAAVDPTCLAAAEELLTRGFVRAESRGGCGHIPDRTGFGDVLDGLIMTVASAVHPAEPANACEATKLSAVATALGARIDCHRKAERKGTDVATQCVDRAGAALLRRFGVAEADGACTVNDDARTIVAMLDEDVERIAGLLRPTRRVSVSSAGRAARVPSVLDRISSVNPNISADGRIVVFNSNAEDLVAGDVNGNDIFDSLAHDVVGGTTELLSVSSDGIQVDADPGFLVISGDGRYVAFESRGTTLVPDDTNEAPDVFVRDRLLGTTERVSVDSLGIQTELRQPSNGACISEDGRFVAFYSSAANLVPDDTNFFADVFVHDRLSGTTERVSIGVGGTQTNQPAANPGLSADGRWVAFWTAGSNLVPGDVQLNDDVFLVDRLAGTIEMVSETWDGTPSEGMGNDVFWRPSISADGRFVAFAHSAGNIVPGDTNGLPDVFVRDRLLGNTHRLSVGTGGSEPDGQSIVPVITSDGRFIAFESEATNLVPGDTNGHADVFVLDRASGVIVRASEAADGTQADDSSSKPALSADGRRVVFYSKASNVVRNDRNGRYVGYDIFLRSLEWP